MTLRTHSEQRLPGGVRGKIFGFLYSLYGLCSPGFRGECLPQMGIIRERHMLHNIIRELFHSV